MKANEDKCHCIGSTNELAEIQMGHFSIKNSASEKFLGVNIDNKLNFDCHVNHLCNKANKELGTRNFLIKSFFLHSQKVREKKQNCHELIF